MRKLLLFITPHTGTYQTVTSNSKPKTISPYFFKSWVFIVTPVGPFFLGIIFNNAPTWKDVRRFSLHELEVIQDTKKSEKILWHDMKHHMIELKTLLKEEKILEARKYVKDMEQFIVNSDESVATGNQEVDGILDYMLKNANRDLKEVKAHLQRFNGI